MAALAGDSSTCCLKGLQFFVACCSYSKGFFFLRDSLVFFPLHQRTLLILIWRKIRERRTTLWMYNFLVLCSYLLSHFAFLLASNFSFFIVCGGMKTD